MKKVDEIEQLKRQTEQTLLMLWALGESLVATRAKGGAHEGWLKKEPRPERNIYDAS